ncbi:hypothetical protein ACFW04_010758 [Cataglyphis niger]
MHLPQRNLAYRFSYPYNIQKSPNYEITFFIQLSGGIYSAIINCTVDCYISILLLHVCAQLINLGTTLNNLVGELANRSIPFAKTIEDCFNAVLLIQMLSCTVQLCFQGFHVFRLLINEEENESSTFQLIFLVTFVGFVLVHLYIYCYVGEMLLVQSTEMGFSAYESNWFNVPGKETRSLLLIMHRSSMPLCLTAGKFSTFSLQMFSKIVRTSLGYLSVLLTVTDRGG